MALCSLPGMLAFILSLGLRLLAARRLDISPLWALQGAALDGLPLLGLGLLLAGLPRAWRRLAGAAMGLAMGLWALSAALDGVVFWQAGTRFDSVVLQNLEPTSLRAFAGPAELSLALALLLACLALAGSAAIAARRAPELSWGAAGLALALAAGLLACAWSPFWGRDLSQARLGKPVVEEGREEAQALVSTSQAALWRGLLLEQVRAQRWRPPQPVALSVPDRIWAQGAGLGQGAEGSGPGLRLKRVVVITVESLSNRLIASCNPRLPRGLTPGLDRLLREQPHLSRCQSVGHETDQGQYAVLCGRLDFARVNRPYPGQSLARAFAAHGFATLHLHGSSVHYRSHWRSYPAMLGTQKLMGLEDFPGHPASDSDGWGGALDDRALFSEALAQLQAGRGQPLLMVINTLDTHPPYRRQPPEQSLPEGLRGAMPLLKAVWQLDQDLSAFLRGLKARGLDGPGTLVVVTADHAPVFSPQYLMATGAMAYGLEPVPMIFWGGASRALARVDSRRLCDQMDLLPTLCGLQGWPVPASAMGADLRLGWKGRALGQRGRVLSLLGQGGAEERLALDSRGLPQALDKPLARWYRWQLSSPELEGLAR